MCVFVRLFVFLCRAVVEDVLAAVKHVHVSGLMHEKVLADIGRWVKIGQWDSSRNRGACVRDR